jgi:hypothetical protein
MPGSLDALIDFLLEQIALHGEEGTFETCKRRSQEQQDVKDVIMSSAA